MAIMNCPACDERISNKSGLCPHCSIQINEVDEERVRELRRRKLRDNVYHMKMSSYAALTLLLIAFGWYLADTSWFQHQSSMGPYILFAIGAVAYMVIRVFLFRFKMALRRLN